jgi:hypothetical protein
VRSGMDLAAGEQLMTREMVAGESWRCLAKDLRLTCSVALLEREGLRPVADLGRRMDVFGGVVWHNGGVAARVREGR